MIERYEQRAAMHATSRDAEARRSKRIARLRLATFLPAAGGLVWSLTGGAPWPVAATSVILLVVFGALVVWHARVDERMNWFDALHVVNVHNMARIGRAWHRLPPADPPPGLDLERHQYAVDLDLFGRASVMQWLGPAATPHGRMTLEGWLLGPAGAAVIPRRQEAVVELTPAAEWREQLGAHGRMASGIREPELEQFLRWAESAGAFTPAFRGRLRVAVLAITMAIWALIALHAAGVTEAAYWLIPMVAGMVLSFATAAGVHGQFDRAGAGQHAFARYAHLFEHATMAPRGAAYLQELHERLTAAGLSAPACMRRLNRILGFASLRAGAAILHFPIQAATLWDFHVFFALDRWRDRVGPRARDWMQAVGELDALSAFGQVRADNPEWAMPEVDVSARQFVAADLGHPLIPDDRRVHNAVAVGPPGTLLLITGSNMSGKSTLLRAIGVNAVLAHAGGAVCAKALRLPPLDVETSIRVHDSLEHGLSYFMAALARLKHVVDRARQAGSPDGRIVMYLLDEVLQGTNSAERAIAVRGVARQLLASGAIGVMTTHDLGLADEAPLNTAATLAHFTEIVDEQGGMTFDYRLRPGLATSRNALRLMELIGIDLREV